MLVTGKQFIILFSLSNWKLYNDFQGIMFLTKYHLLKVVEYFRFAIIKHDLTDIYADILTEHSNSVWLIMT